MEITFRLYVSFVTSPRLKILIWTDTDNEDQYSERFWVKSVKIQVFPSPTGCWHLWVSFFECKVYSESRFLTRIRNLPKVLNSNPAHLYLAVGSPGSHVEWGHLSLQKDFDCQLCTPDVLTSLPQSWSSARDIFRLSAACSFTSASSCQSLSE